jgi:hypothetical protein
VLASWTVGSPPRVVAGGADRTLAKAQHCHEPIRLPGMADANPPAVTVGGPPPDNAVTASVDHAARRPSQLPGRQVDRQALGERAEIQQQRPVDGHGAGPRVQVHVAEAGRGRGVQPGADPGAGAVVAVKTARLQQGADGGVERAAGRLSQRQPQPQGLSQDGAHPDRLADTTHKPADLAVPVEPGAHPLHPLEPAKGTLDRCRPSRSGRGGYGQPDRDDGVHPYLHPGRPVGERDRLGVAGVGRPGRVRSRIEFHERLAALASARWTATAKSCQLAVAALTTSTSAL